jgi:ABC-2 type transport system ATP-binding protein
MTSIAVRCVGLVKRYGDVLAVDQLDLTIHEGECFALLGPNGAGKTTTVEMMQGILEPDAGTIEVLGLQWRHDAAEIRQRMGTQLQETVLPDKLKVIEILQMFRSFYRKGVDVEAVLELVQLTEKRNARTHALSGGQRQRLAVGTALVCDPDVLFLDEPTTGLDPQSRRQLWGVINDFKQRGRTVVLTTHYMEEAQRLCDRVAVVDKGRIIALGSPAELIASLEAEHIVEFASEVSFEIDVLQSLPGVRAVHLEDGVTRLTVGRVHEAVPALMSLIARRGVDITELTTHHATLEDVFLSLTGRHLRDG